MSVRVRVCVCVCELMHECAIFVFACARIRFDRWFARVIVCAYASLSHSPLLPPLTCGRQHYVFFYLAVEAFKAQYQVEMSQATGEEFDYQLLKASAQSIYDQYLAPKVLDCLYGIGMN